MYKGKLKIEDVPILIFVFNTYHASFRVMYGAHEDGLKMLVYGNVAGIPLGIILFSTFVYKRFSETKLKAWLIIIGFAIVLASVFCFILLFLNNFHKWCTGFTGSFFTLCLYTGPLTKSITCVQRKNHNIIPLFYTIMAFCVALFWGLYGVGNDDVILMYSNGTGTIVTGMALVIKLVVFLLNRSNEESSCSSEEDDEEKDGKKIEEQEEENEISKIIEMIGDQLIPEPIHHDERRRSEHHHHQHHHRDSDRKNSKTNQQNIEMSNANLGENLVDNDVEKKENNNSAKKEKVDEINALETEREVNERLETDRKLIEEKEKKSFVQKHTKELTDNQKKQDPEKDDEDNAEVKENRK